jgi:hypothetical protein
LGESKSQRGRLAWRDNVGKGFCEAATETKTSPLALAGGGRHCAAVSTTGSGKKPMDIATYLEDERDFEFIRDGVIA